MTQAILYGLPPSSYVRTARWALAEKGVPYELRTVAPGSDEIRKVHPWGKMPAFEHRGVVLFETSAIVRYVDEAFSGPALQPKEPAPRARMDQWISAHNCYIYPHAIRDYALRYILPKLRGQEPDRAAIEAGVPKMKNDLVILDQAYAKNAWIVSEQITLADLFVGPVLATLSLLPEAQAVLEGCSNLRRVLKAIGERDAYKSAQPG